MVCSYTGYRFSVVRSVTGQYDPRRSSLSSIDHGFCLARSASFYPGFTGKSGYLLRRFDTLSRRKAKNTLGSSLYFNGRNSSVSYLYSSRKRAFLNRKFPAHKRGATQRFGKSRCSASDDLYFSMDAASAYQNSGLNGYSA